MSPLIRTCRACGVDVSVTPGAAAACPRCGGALATPRDPHGDAPDRTLLEARAGAETRRDAGSDEEHPAARHATRDDASRPDDSADGFVDTATMPEGLAFAAAAAAARAGRRLGPYELRQILGKGGMGVVYEAYHPQLERTVALKVMSDAAGDGEELERFKREARAAAKLRHPNIISIHEVGEAAGTHYFTMDLVRGRTLQAMAREGALPPDESARLLAKVARAIHFAHEHAIIHRDLKPSNVIVDEHGEPHVMDFGLAKDLSDVSGLTLTGVAMGSPPYMPPEQARGDFKQVDAVSDVYALGATLYECLTGRPPFRGKSLYDVVAKVLVEEPESPRKAREDVPYDLETVCLKALEKEKWRRYPSALDLALDLERHLEGRTIRAVRQGLTTRMGRVIARHRLQIFSALVPLAVTAALAAYVFGARPGPPPVEPPVPIAAQRLAGPIARAGEHLEGAEEATLELLLSLPFQPPTWAAVEASLAGLPPDGAARLTFEAARGLGEALAPGEARPEARPEALAVPPAVLARLALALVRDPAVPLDTLGGLVGGWVADRPALGELARRAALALRGRRSEDPEAFRLALRGPLTVLDRAILTCAARGLPAFHGSFAAARDALSAPGSPQRALLELPVAPRYSVRTGAILAPGPEEPAPHAPARAHPWRFPPVRLPGEEAGPGAAPPLRALSTPRGASDLLPTPPLRTASGERVLVAWLRFLYVLDDGDGRVLRRVRLPGLAKRLEHAPEGGFVVSVARGAETLRVHARVELGPGEPEVRLRALVGDEGAVRPAERALEPAELLPTAARDAAGQLEREACALVPELDRALEVRRARPEGGAERLRLDEAPVPVGFRFELGFRQEGAHTPCLVDEASGEGPAVLQVAGLLPARDGALRPPLVAGDELLDARLLAATTDRPRLELRVRRAGRTLLVRYGPWDRVPPAEWQEVAERAYELAVADPDPNPWVQAFAAVAAVLGGAPADDPAVAALAQGAARSEHLTPVARVRLGCRLDEVGLERAADLAFERALRDLLRDHAYLPSWAGYGPLDPGRALARRVERCRLTEERPERAAALARWRDAFAPVLRESRFAERAYARAGVSLTAPAADPLGSALAAAPAGAAPAGGIAGLSALTLQRIDHVIRLQGWFLFSLGGLLAITFVRYRRHAARDLARLGAEDFAARQLMWLRRPLVRLRYAWPTYLTLGDKLGFVLLYLVFFGVFAFQDAGLEALVVQRRVPQPLLAGTPAEPATLRWLEEQLPAAGPPRPEQAYAIAWLRAARGLPADERCLAALGASARPQDRLLAAEVLLARGEAAAARPHLVAARADPALGPWADHLAAEGAPTWLPGAAPPPAALPDARGRLAAALDAAPRVLAPAPDAVSRDRLLLGTDRWWAPLPALFARNLVQPFPERVDASIEAFRSAYNWNLELARLRNRWFFLVPATLVLLLASLFMPIVHPFEPLPSDLGASRSLRVLRLLFPGLPQFQRGRPLRGLLLLLPFFYVAQTLYQALTGRVFLGKLEDFTTRLSPLEISDLTAEAVCALPVVRIHHYLELAAFLGVVYALHWIDLALTQRKLFRSGAEAGGAAAPSRYVIPLDSAPGAAPRSASRPPSESDVAGPFDVTEKQSFQPGPLRPPSSRLEPPEGSG